MRSAVGLVRGVTETLGLGHHGAEAAQTLVGQRGARLLLRLRLALRGFRLDLADRLFQRQPLAGDVGFVERRIDAAQLADQRGARALIQRTADFAGVLVETGDGARDQGVIVSHCLST